MFDFLGQKVLPVLLGLSGVACIDTPGNFVQRILLNVLDGMSAYFQMLSDCLR